MERRTRRFASPRGSASPGVPIVAEETRQVAQGKPTWGRFKGSFGATLGCLAIIATTPFLSFWFVMACEHFDCQLVSPLLEVFVYGAKPFSWITQHFPVPTWAAFKVWLVWYVYQTLMAVFFPGPKGYGQLTPAGNVLEYKVNGMNVWIVTHILFIGGAYLGFFPATIVYDHWPALVVIANIWGNLLAFFTFVKAYYFPTHAEDRKFSGNVLYDYFMGIEFNPRIGDLDFKLFFNGRPGICGWTVINISFAAAQYAKHGYVTNSMLIVNLLHAIYVVDFFYNEDWYLRTIDIAHDHFGWMLAWGDSVWLPFTYTLQGYFLVTHPVVLSHFEAFSILALGFGGYYIFRSCNHQKDFFRANDGNCTIWGKPARYVAATFTTSDGKTRNSKLLTSGWWGLSRHFNYVGDLMISLAYCLPCGFTHLMPYYYIIYMTMLLVHRTQRDDTRCGEKYGHYWAEYKRQVPWKILPYVY